MSSFDTVNPPDDPFDQIAAMVDHTAERVAKRHYMSPTQEHQLSAKLADAIEHQVEELLSVPGGLEVSVQDFPEKASKWEKATGADLYVSTVRTDAMDDPFSKGMLVQSKWDRTFDPLDPKLREQCRKMIERSPSSSYVWIFRPDHVYSVKAEDVLSYKQIIPVQTVGRQIADGLRCTQGDHSIGRNTALPLPESLNEVMRDLAVERVLEFRMTKPLLKPKRAPRRRKTR